MGAVGNSERLLFSSTIIGLITPSDARRSIIATIFSASSSRSASVMRLSLDGGAEDAVTGLKSTREMRVSYRSE